MAVVMMALERSVVSAVGGKSAVAFVIARVLLAVRVGEPADRGVG